VLYLAATLDEGELARVQRRVQVTRTPPPSAVAPRVTTSAREYQPGPLRAEAGAPPSLQLDARVPAGVCVPEVPCEIRVWVGGDMPVAISLEPTEGVEVAERAEPTTGVARLVLLVRRLEATVTLRASVDGAWSRGGRCSCPWRRVGCPRAWIARWFQQVSPCASRSRAWEGRQPRP
jgi:hypothetical protein